MASLVGFKVLVNNKPGEIVSSSFGNSDPRYGRAVSGHPIFTVRLDDGTVLTKVPLTSIVVRG